MKNEIRTPLGLGFTLIERSEGKVLPVEKGLDLSQQLQRLDDVGAVRVMHHHYCGRLLDFMDSGRKTFNEIGQSVKIQSIMPITVVRYALHTHPAALVYRFVNTIYLKGQSTFDHTTGFKLRDFIKSEFKTLFNVTYELQMEEGSEPFMIRRNYPNTSRINEAIAAIHSFEHPAFVLQAIKGLAPLEPNKVVRGRFFEVTLSLKEGGNFTIQLKSNKPTGDGALITYEEGRFHVTLVQPVLKVGLEVTDQLLFEILYCLSQECNYNTPVQRTMNQLKDYKRQKAH